MKLLKLDARFEDARRVARCLVGSVADESRHKEITKDPKLAYIDDGHFVVLFWDVTGMDFDIKHTITLPIDTLKFCPFTAMRERVEVVAQDDGWKIHGVIMRGNMKKNAPTFRVSSLDGTFSWFSEAEITLDLNLILQGGFLGCEIVEVGE